MTRTAMRRRRALLGASIALAVLGPARAKPLAGKRFRIGWLSSSAYPGTPLWDAFLAEMRALGWVEGTHFEVEHRHYEGHAERLPALAAELVERVKVDLIVAPGTPPAIAARAATRTIPIVFFYVGDPVGSRLVASLAHPGGNATGTGGLGSDLYVKQLDLLKQAVPKAAHVGVLRNLAFAAHAAAQPGLERAAAQLGLALEPVELATPEAIDAAFETMARKRVDALHVLAQPFLFPRGEQIARHVAALKLPAIAGPVEFAEAGLLMAYGDKLIDAVRRVPYFIDRILGEGVAPAELPVEQATRFYLTVNRRTARALGLELPPSIRVRVDRIIE